MPQRPRRKRVAILGAGPSGMASLRAFAIARKASRSASLETSEHSKLSNDNTESSWGTEQSDDLFPEIVCYEKQRDWGGLWNYSDATGIDRDITTALKRAAAAGSSLEMASSNGSTGSVDGDGSVSDEIVEFVHGSMYHNLWSNAPKECMELPDYSFADHFGADCAIGSYPPRAVILDYLKGRLAKAATPKKSWVKFCHVVRYVKYHEDTQNFSLECYDWANKIQVNDTVDHVIVATGHFSCPNIPHFDGLPSSYWELVQHMEKLENNNNGNHNNHNGTRHTHNKKTGGGTRTSTTTPGDAAIKKDADVLYQGRVIHAHDFRDGEQFRNKNILLVGSSFSAEDIGLQCYKYGAKSVTVSYRTRPMGFKWPNNWATKPLLIKAHGTTCHFKDGSTKEDIHAIILCTGYQHSFPFLDDAIRLNTFHQDADQMEKSGSNNLWLPDLYRGVALVRSPKIHYLGMHDQYYTMPMFDAQAWWSRDVILGSISIPSCPLELQKDCTEWATRHATLITDEDKIWFQGDYIKSLIEQVTAQSDDSSNGNPCPLVKLQIKGINKVFVQWSHDKHEDIIGYRHNSYRSLVTGKRSGTFSVPWIKATDDSMEYYLRHCRPNPNPEKPEVNVVP